MKYNVYFNNGLYAGTFTAVVAEAGFGTWCWARKANKTNYYYLLA